MIWCLSLLPIMIQAERHPRIGAITQPEEFVWLKRFSVCTSPE
jgi:hypothetical protein